MKYFLAMLLSISGLYAMEQTLGEQPLGQKINKHRDKLERSPSKSSLYPKQIVAYHIENGRMVYARVISIQENEETVGLSLCPYGDEADFRTPISRIALIVNAKSQSCLELREQNAIRPNYSDPSFNAQDPDNAIEMK